MRPDGETTNAFLYCLAVAARRSEVQVVFFLAMSNHYHAGLIDSAGRLPEFLEYFHKLFSKHQNVLRGRTENFWSSEQTSVVELVGPEDVLDKMVYTLTNPVKDHLVAQAAEWPGATSLDATLRGRAVIARRPTHFFRPDGPMPEDITLDLVRAPGFEHLGPGEFSALLIERIGAVEQSAATTRRQTGLSIKGVSAVLAQPWSAQPDTEASRHELNPRVASRNIWRRIETIRRNKAFVAAYRAARDMLLAGAEAIFPAGTYWLRRFAGISCEHLPSCAA